MTKLEQFIATVPSLESADLFDLLYAGNRDLYQRAASDVSGWESDGIEASQRAMEKARKALRAEINKRFPKRSP